MQKKTRKRLDILTLCLCWRSKVQH